MTERLQQSAAQHGKRGPSSAGEVRLCCPFCHGRTGKPDRKFSLSANPSLGVWCCHRCDAGGRGDLAFLGGGPGGDIRGVPPDTLGPPPGFLLLRDHDGLTARQYRGYVAQRGCFDAALAAGAGFCIEGRYAARVVVPVRGVGGTWHGFVARSIWPHAAKVGVPAYLYPPGMPRGRVLYNGLALHDETEEPAFVVEGVFDALHLWPDGVAVLGKPTTDQLAMLTEARRPVVVALDGDAWREGMALSLQLRALGIRSAWLKLPPRTDPDEVPAAQLREQARDALKEAVTWGSCTSSGTSRPGR